MTEKTTRSADAGEGPSLARAEVYGRILGLVLDVTRSLADEIGAGMTRAKLASDIRFTMLLGYLNAQLVNRRYPWSERATLRANYVEHIIVAVERCMLEGPANASR